MSTEPKRNRSRRKPHTRLVMISAAIGALLVLVVSALLNWPTGGGGSGPGGSGGDSTSSSPPVFEAQAGACLNWTRADATDIHQVGCPKPHLFEITGRADLHADFGNNAPFPSNEQWQLLKQERCTQVSMQYLAGRFDPNGRLDVGAFTPNDAGWKAGDRTLHCGLQQPGASGKLYRFDGSASKMDQSDTYEVGRCLGISGTTVWDPIDCQQPHSVEITGQVNLGKQFSSGTPAESEQDNYLATKCGELTAQYAGSPTAVTDKGLVSYWDTLLPESWAAGSREVNCKVSAQLPDGSGLAPVTGSVKDDVQVGKEPAPEITATDSPGGPGQNPR